MKIGSSEIVKNETAVTQFILLGFGQLQEFNGLLFLEFSMIYILTMSVNCLIVMLVTSDHNLHTPMYYCLANLSCLEVFYSSTILPKMLSSFLTGDKSISVWGCFAQFFCFACLATVECFLLSIMSFDRYVAICRPLHYATTMNGRVVFHLMVASWLCAASILITIISLVSQLSFCGPQEIDHFFCDFSPLLRLSCSDTSHIRLFALIFGSIDILPPFILTIISYVCIIATILRIPCATGRQKAFGTCSTHLIVVTIFYGTIMIVYILPNTRGLRDLKKVFSIPYSILTPLVNPLIYSLRNKEVKESMKRAQKKFIIFKGMKRWYSSTC